MRMGFSATSLIMFYNKHQTTGNDGGKSGKQGNWGNNLPLPPPKGDKNGKWSSSIPLWRGCRGRSFLMNN
jgi:hypothetical protein